jgi:tetraacyldisaccharide 4'-kinase
VKLEAKVISVGNLTVGGTGKTPAVERLTRVLQSRGRKVAILSRGYKSRPSGSSKPQVRIVTDGRKIALSASEAGDEPYLLARNLSGVPVVIGKDRIAGGKYCLRNFASEVFFLDDGFQYRRLKRDLDIVLINSLNPFGNERLFPAGILREPLASLKRADLFILTRTDQVAPEHLERVKERLKGIDASIPILDSIHLPLHFEDLKSKKKCELKFIENKKVLALSSIADPASFKKTLTGLGAIVVKELRYPDHYSYTKEDLKTITRDAKGSYIVTTEKDRVRLEPPLGDDTVLVLKIELRITRGEEILEKML